MISDEALETLKELDMEIGEGWCRHAMAANAADDLLHIPIADGVMDTKIDGWIHAGNLTAKSLARYASSDSKLDICDVTTWQRGGGPAVNFARSQVDFHWEIDTRMWQYFLYLVFMRRSIRDAVRRSDDITGADEREIIRLNNEFWDEVFTHYAYRTEIIERVRGFAEHPDESAGSGRYGYQYEVTWDREDWSAYTLDALDLDVDEELIKRDVTSRDDSGSDVAPPNSFPAVEKTIESPVGAGAQTWIDAAKNVGVCDEYLRVQIGIGEEERWIPTRFVGWKTSIEEVTLPYLEAFVTSLDDNESAIRFGRCQAEFQRRLEGTADQINAYLRTQRRGIKRLAEADPDAAFDGEDVERFFETASETAGDVLDRSIEVNADTEPALEEERPIHPRFAPYDPMEPLPWNTDDPEMHQKFMEVRGFTI